MRALLLVLCLAAACRDAPAPPPAPQPAPVRVVQRPPPPPVLEIEEDEPEGGVDVSEVLVNLQLRTGVILDVEDRCPDAPEDNEGFEDVDGCPDVM